MDAWKNTGSESGRGADAAADGALRAAEQTVGQAWMGRLLLAESETEAVLGACARVRRRAADRVRAARDHERAQNNLARELSQWSEGVARSARLAWTDQSSAGQR